MSRRTARNKFLAITAALLMALTFNACGQNGLETLPSVTNAGQSLPTPSPAPTATVTPSPSPSPTVSPSPSATPKPTVSPTATPTPSPSPSPTATASPSPTVSPSPSPSPSPTASPTVAPSPSDPSNPYGRWVLTGYGGRHMTSADGGVTWTNDVSDVANGGDDSYLQRAATYFKGLFLTFGWRIQSSTNGVTFSSTTLGAWLGGVAEGDGRLVAVGSCGGRTYSDDGVKWTEVRDSYSNACQHLRSVVYGNGMYFAYGDNGNRMTSTNGTVWTKHANYTVTGVAYGFGYFWGVAGTQVVRSTDGITWSAVTVSGATTPTAFSFVNNYLLLTTNSSNYRTVDGTNWVAWGSGMSGPVKYGGGVYIGIGWQKVYRSTDGKTWTSKSTGSNSLVDSAWKP